MIAALAYGEPMHIDRLDHLVLTVADIDATTDFYIRVFGMKAAPSAFPLARGREPKIHYLSKDSGGGKEPFQEPM